MDSKNRFTPEEQKEIAESIEQNKREAQRERDNFGIVFAVVWILVALVLAKNTHLGLMLSGIIGIFSGWLVASRLK